jgi:hypothetical protein
MDLTRFTVRQLEAMHRVAKDPARGLYPFFKDPRAMIALRDAITRRLLKDHPMEGEPDVLADRCFTRLLPFRVQTPDLAKYSSHVVRSMAARVGEVQIVLTLGRDGELVISLKRAGRSRGRITESNIRAICHHLATPWPEHVERSAIGGTLRPGVMWAIRPGRGDVQ